MFHLVEPAARRFPSWMVRCGVLALLALAVISGPAPAQNQDQNPDQEPDRREVAVEVAIASLTSAQLEEMFTFVAGNALFTAYHEAGHMLVSELQIPILGQEEDAVDNLATVSMLAADTGDMDLFLINAMIGWFLIASDDSQDMIFHGEHDLDLQRGYRVLCLMVGADEEAFLDLARDLGMPQERIDTCEFDYGQVADSWVAATDPHLRDGDTPAGMISVVHEEAPQGLEVMALFLMESGILELVAEELDTLYDLPDQVVFRGTSCGVANAFWDPSAREVTLCYELLQEFAMLYLTDLMDPA